MDKSIFIDKNTQPGDEALAAGIGGAHALWQDIILYVRGKMPGVVAEWNFGGEKFGWSFRVKDRERVIIYLLPRDKYFKVAMVFGEKATAQVLDSKVSQYIKDELAEARPYAEGRGIRLAMDRKMLKDVQLLIDIKMAN